MDLFICYFEKEKINFQKNWDFKFQEHIWSVWRNGKMHGIETACVPYAQQYSRNMSADDKCALEWILQGKWNDARRRWVWWFKQWNIILGLWEVFLAASSVSSQKLCKYDTMPVSSTELPRLNLNLPRIVLATFNLTIVMNIHIF